MDACVSATAAVAGNQSRAIRLPSTLPLRARTILGQDASDRTNWLLEGVREIRPLVEDSVESVANHLVRAPLARATAISLASSSGRSGKVTVINSSSRL